MKKVFLAVVAGILLFTITLTPTANETVQAKTMWGKIELKKDMIGKVKILKDTYQYSISNKKLKIITKLKKGKEYGVYSYSKNYGGVYKMGSNKYVKKGSSIKYYKAPQNLLNDVKQESNQTDNQNKGQKVALTYDKNTGSIKFNGLSLGVTKKKVIGNLGLPAEEGSNRHWEKYQSYKFPGSWFSEELYIYYADSRVDSISYQGITGDYLLPDKKFLSSFDGDIYVSPGVFPSVIDQYLFISRTQTLYLRISPDTSPGSGLGNSFNYYNLSTSSYNMTDFKKVNSSYFDKLQ